MNAVKTFVLMLVMTLLVVWVGQLVGGQQGMIMALIFAGVMHFVSYWFSDKIVLMMYGAKEIKPGDMPQLHDIVERLTKSSGLPMPRLYFIDTPMPNAFATGRNPEHSAVAVTRGILDILSDEELSGVIAHELSHVRNRDILISTIAATAAGAIFMLARMAQFAAIFGGGRDRDGEGGNPIGLLVVAIIAPIAAMIVQMAISRSREYQADETGAKISGNPLALAGALRKLTEGVKRNPTEVNPTTAHMFIVSPFAGKSLLTLFSTHPPLEDRIQRLEKMAAESDKYKIPNIIY
jgi:heat shock protein HtpX